MQKLAPPELPTMSVHRCVPFLPRASRGQATRPFTTAPAPTSGAGRERGRRSPLLYGVGTRPVSPRAARVLEKRTTGDALGCIVAGQREVGPGPVSGPVRGDEVDPQSHQPSAEGQ